VDERSQHLRSAPGSDYEHVGPTHDLVGKGARHVVEEGQGPQRTVEAMDGRDRPTVEEQSCLLGERSELLCRIAGNLAGSLPDHGRAHDGEARERGLLLDGDPGVGELAHVGESLVLGKANGGRAPRDQKSGQRGSEHEDAAQPPPIRARDQDAGAQAHETQRVGNGRRG
jgi:hypothetical protein